MCNKIDKHCDLSHIKTVKITETETRVLRDRGMAHSNGCSCLRGPELLSYKPGRVTLFSGGDGTRTSTSINTTEAYTQNLLKMHPIEANSSKVS